VPLNVLKRSILAAAKASFLPEDERQELVNNMEEKLGLKLLK